MNAETTLRAELDRRTAQRAEFNQTHLCDQLERTLRRGPVRQARRAFTRLFNRFWPDIHPDPQRHPVLTRLIELHEAKLIQDGSHISSNPKDQEL